LFATTSSDWIYYFKTHSELESLEVAQL